MMSKDIEQFAIFQIQDDEKLEFMGFSIHEMTSIIKFKSFEAMLIHKCAVIYMPDIYYDQIINTQKMINIMANYEATDGFIKNMKGEILWQKKL